MRGNGAWDPRDPYKGLREVIAEAIEKSGDNVAVDMMSNFFLDTA